MKEQTMSEKQSNELDERRKRNKKKIIQRRVENENQSLINERN
jgi:hypothetical protein